jgi:NAD(P)-dependent dehydrogenase (short-subunit alcohol dehydrogenase family)
MSGRVEGKTALITGGGSGLGRASATHLAREGANVIVSDLNGDTAQETADTINAERQGAAVSCQHDATSEDDWNSALNLCQEHFGALHVLLNNAGISIGGDIESTDFDTWKNFRKSMSIVYFGDASWHYLSCGMQGVDPSSIFHRLLGLWGILLHLVMEPRRPRFHNQVDSTSLCTTKI